MGDAPDWFLLIRVAKYLGVPPWDLGRMPVGWYRMAVQMMALESQKAAADSRTGGGV